MNRPNEVWQIDHTVVDVIVVDEQLRRPIGRPILTIAVDICTRMVTGFYLSLDPPSSASVGLCLLHAAYEKTAWLAERGIDLSWPAAWLPSILHCDNEAEFHSHALQVACREYGMRLQYRPPATPRFGGHVERPIGTMVGAVHMLPGTNVDLHPFMGLLEINISRPHVRLEFFTAFKSEPGRVFVHLKWD